MKLIERSYDLGARVAGRQVTPEQRELELMKAQQWGPTWRHAAWVVVGFAAVAVIAAALTSTH